MLARLALETRAHHAAADADRLALLEAPTGARYRAFLESVYAFETRYERALIQTPHLEPRIIRACTRTHLLRNDLVALGATEETLAAISIPVIPPFRSEAQALGWVYVVERNTLLHGLVRRHLWRILPRDISRGGSYLAAYSSPGTHYRELGLEIDAAAARTPPSTFIEAATEAFAGQRLWFAQSRAESRKKTAS
jgi:heme oxygenase